MSELRDQQLAFTAYLRDPAHRAAPEGIEERRLAVYRDLFFNNIAGLLASNFPVIKQTLGEDRWRDLVREFFAHHRSKTPLFPQIGAEFVEHMRTYGDHWLRDLAHYEHVELVLSIAEDALPPHDPDGDLMTGALVFSPLARLLVYGWPVHEIGPGYDAQDAPGRLTVLLAAREPNGEVRFTLTSDLTGRMVQLIEALPGASGRDVLAALAAEAAPPVMAQFLHDGAAELEKLRRAHVLLGTAPRC